MAADEIGEGRRLSELFLIAVAIKFSPSETMATSE